MLLKEIDPHKYMNDWEKSNKETLPEKNEFYNNLNLRYILEEDYTYEKRIYRDFDIKNLGKYHALFLRSNVLLLADVSENFRKMCL